MAEFNREEIDYEDQLRQSERERKDLKNIIYELPVGLITVKGGNELTIDIANHEFCRMSGYELADFSMEKMSMAQLIHMEDYMMFEDAAEVCRRGKTSDEFEARIVTADQNVIWANVSVSDLHIPECSAILSCILLGHYRAQEDGK